MRCRFVCRNYSIHRSSVADKEQRPIGFAVEGLCPALYVTSNCGIRVKRIGQGAEAFHLDASLFCHTPRGANFRPDALPLGYANETLPYCAKNRRRFIAVAVFPCGIVLAPFS
jgi:hypothetical protein